MKMPSYVFKGSYILSVAALQFRRPWPFVIVCASGVCELDEQSLVGIHVANCRLLAVIQLCCVSMHASSAMFDECCSYILAYML